MKKDFAIWNNVPNYSIATGNPLPKDFAKIGVSLNLIVSDIPPETTLNQIIDRLNNSEYGRMFSLTEKTRGEYNSSGFREAWPKEVKDEEGPFRIESPDRIITWESLG